MILNDFYRSKEWLLFRLGVIADRTNDDGVVVCEHCGKPIVRQYDIIAHHKEPLTERNFRDAGVALNPDNIMLVHHVCHNHIHNKFGRIEREVYVVWGSPLSGKSTWVESVREPGDLVIDMDNIWECVSGCERYVKPDRLKANVFGVRDLLIDQVVRRVGKWNAAYIIGGYPLSGERERLLSRVGGRGVYIETSKEECMRRLELVNDARARQRSEWKKYIEDWWEKFSKSPHP